MTLRALTWIAVLATLANMTAAAEDWPAETWPTAKPADAGLDAARLAEARDHALTSGGAGYVTRGGRLVMSWGDARQRFDLKSSSKSIGVTALGLAIADGKLAVPLLAILRVWVREVRLSDV